MHIDKASEKKRNISTFKKFCALYIYIYLYTLYIYIYIYIYSFPITFLPFLKFI